MSTQKVARVLKMIKDECYKDIKKYPEYYEPFFDDPVDFSIFDLVSLFEVLNKNKNGATCIHEQTLYKYLSNDELELANNLYADELQDELQALL